MAEILLTFLNALYDLGNDMAIYILAGLLFAGILHELIPASMVEKHLGNDTVSSVVKSTLFGVPLPVCSCGVIPLATAIKQSGASKGATLSFLISTPITGIDSILATFGMFGWAFTLYRIVTSVIIAVVAGILTNIAETGSKARPTPRFSMQPPQPESDASCCSGGSCSSAEPARGFSLLSALRYGFITLFGDIAKPLFWGLVIGAAITAAVPDDLASWLEGHQWLGYLIAVAIAVPMYVCATASLPIAASLIFAGVAPGAAFVFLSAGPATNTVTIGVVKKMLGTQALMIYLGTITFGSILFGIGMDLLFSAADIDIKALIDTGETRQWYMIASAFAMWIMLAYFWLKPYLPSSEKQCCDAQQ
jgi:uncharacterized membrane protein YraQ (UPF0718 family)